MRTITHGKRRYLESNLQAGIVKFLKAIGAIVAVTDPGTLRKFGVKGRSTGIPTGWPDLTVLLPGGRMLGIEVKSPKGRQTPAQVQMQNDWQRLGHEYILARTMDDVLDAIEEPNNG